MIFRNSFLEALTEDEHALLYSIVNKDRNRNVVYELTYCRAEIIMQHLQQTNLTEEGNSLRASIFEKYHTL